MTQRTFAVAGIVFVAALFCNAGAAQQTRAVWKLDFGAKEPAEKDTWEDFTPVEPATQYTRERGYGFEGKISWRAYSAERHDPLAADSIQLIGRFIQLLPQKLSLLIHVIINRTGAEVPVIVGNRIGAQDYTRDQKPGANKTHNHQDDLLNMFLEKTAYTAYLNHI